MTKFCQRSGAVALLLAIGLTSTLVSCAREQPKPKSVLLIVVDTLRADYLGTYGYERATSPHIDALAEESLVFLKAFSNAPWTVPSMGSLLTGLDSSRHGAGRVLRRNGRIVTEDGNKTFHALDSSVSTLAEMLSNEGYETAAFVNNTIVNHSLGFARGFDIFDWSDDKTRNASDLVEAANQWLADRQTPFFAWVHLMDPHLPYSPVRKVRGRFTGEIEADMKLPVRGLSKLRTGRLDEDQRRFVRAAYAEELVFVDEQIGRLLRHLEEQGFAEDTVVILTSDHGEELFEHGGFEHGHALFQEVLHIPMLIRWPGVEPRRVAHPVSLVDIAPTLYEAFDLPPIPATTGTSLLDLVASGPEPSDRAILVEDMLYGRDGRALVRWPQKLVLRDGSPPRLFDLESDPGEQHDLAKADPETVERLRQELERRVEANHEQRGDSSAVELGRGVEERLRALGYLD